MSIYKPNIKKMKTRNNVKGLIKALEYHKCHSVSQDAFKVMGEITYSVCCRATDRYPLI